tara:strand:+ start:3565 stop:4608 length:1044 start_codon:yes stop_codon:yes gene_type:complete
MAYGYKQGLDSFWHVERKYNDTKPMVSKNHTEQDNLRPAGRRRSRKWEHIRKLSETCYAICDGQWGDPIFSSYWGGKATPPMPIEDTYNLSPIVWEIMEQPDGSYLETIKIRNGTGDYGHNSRYTFLSEFLPDSISWIQATNGKQYIGAGKVYYLPKSKSVDELRWDYYKRQTSSTSFQREDDQKYLKFARTAHVPEQIYSITDLVFSKWKLISPEFVPVNPKSKVDKERKKELKPYLDAFWEWSCAVGPMLPIEDWEYIRGAKDALREAGVTTSWAYSSQVAYKGNEVQSIITDDNHELRLPLLTMFMLKSNMKHANTPEAARKVRAKFNQWANRACGLITTTKGE